MLQILNLFKESNNDAKEERNKKVLNRTWKPLGRLPMWLSKTEGNYDYKKLKKVNRYLEYMESRLLKIHEQGDYNKIVLIWALLLKNSKSYQITIYHRTKKTWYWEISKKDAVKELTKFMNKCRNWDMKLTLERFYLNKETGDKFEKTYKFKGDERIRPIGSPTYESRMISKALNDLIYFVLHKDLSPFQHAYRLSRGCHTALIEVWFRIVVLKHTQIEEFDFKGFFNSVKIEWVISYMNTKSRRLAYWVQNVYDYIEYKFDRKLDDLPVEREIKVEPQFSKKWKHLIERKGLPQGLSISPILATALLNYLPKLEGLVMYADDGLIIRKRGSSDEDIKQWFNWAWKLGIYREESKSGPVKNQFKFLGINFDLEKEEVSYKESKWTWKGRDINSYETWQEIYNWFKLVGQFYGKKPKEWTWNIHPDSFITHTGFHITGRKLLGKGMEYMESLRNILGKLINHRTYKGYRWFVGRGIYHISSSSTKCCVDLLRLQKDLRLVKVKSISWSGPTRFNRYKSKGKYFEEMELNRVDASPETEFSYIYDQRYWEEMKEKMNHPRVKIVEGDNHIAIRRTMTNKYNLRGRKLK